MASCENPQPSTIRVVFTFSRRYAWPHSSVGMWTLRQHAHPNMVGPLQEQQDECFQVDEQACR